LTAPFVNQPIPTGAVTFVLDGAPLGAPVALINGVATSAPTPAISVGPHTIAVSYSGDGVYNPASVAPSTVTVGKAMLTVTADSKSRSLGLANPPLTYVISGFVNGETAAVVSGAPTLGVAATPSSPPGDYPINVAQGTLSAANYLFTPLVAGVLTVRRRTALDFEGTGKAQIAYFSTADAQWYRLGASGGFSMGRFGATNYTDIPVPGDYLGLGSSQLAVFRPSTAQWFVLSPTGSRLLGTFGAPNLGDIPVPGDYLGLGYTQMAVFRPSTAQWFVLSPTGSRLLGTFGAANLFDIPVPGDYDGTGRTQLAVFRPSTAQWFVLGASGSRLLGTFGGANYLDIPAPADYDGIGRTQLAVYRPSTGTWYVQGVSGSRKLGVSGIAVPPHLPAGSPTGQLISLGVIKPTGSITSSGRRAGVQREEAPVTTIDRDNPSITLSPTRRNRLLRWSGLRRAR
jgi:hypothetical protein